MELDDLKVSELMYFYALLINNQKYNTINNLKIAILDNISKRLDKR